MVLGHNSDIFDENGLNSYWLINSKSNKGITKCNFIKKSKRMVDYGHTLAFRKEFRDKVVPDMINIEGMMFDDGITAIASIFGQYYVLNMPLVRHRIHNTNSTTKHWTLKSRIRDIDRQISSRELKVRRISLYVKYYGQFFDKKTLKIAKDFIYFINKRIVYMKNRQLFRCILQTFHYNPMNNWKFLLTDVFCIVANKNKL